jgi:hypothetical protein
MEGLIVKKTFLSKPEWMIEPFVKLGKSPFDKLLDIVLESPMLLEQGDQLQHLPPAAALPFAVKLLHSCYKLDNQFLIFYKELETSSAEPLFYPVVANTEESSTTQHSLKGVGVGTQQIRFANVPIATTMILYWATLCVLWSGMLHIHKSISLMALLEPTSDGNMLAKAHKESDDAETYVIPIPTRCLGYATMARNVLQSVDFCIDDDSAMATMVGPLNMVIDTLKPRFGFDEEITSAKDKLERISRRGIKIVRHTRHWRGNDQNCKPDIPVKPGIAVGSE